jgi:hypothetical protein
VGAATWAWVREGQGHGQGDDLSWERGCVAIFPLCVGVFPGDGLPWRSRPGHTPHHPTTPPPPPHHNRSSKIQEIPTEVRGWADAVMDKEAGMPRARVG